MEDAFADGGIDGAENFGQQSPRFRRFAFLDQSIYLFDLRLHGRTDHLVLQTFIFDDQYALFRRFDVRHN